MAAEGITLDSVPSGFERDPTCFLAKYLSKVDIARGSHQISRDKKSRD